MVTREIQAFEITKTIKRLCMEANTILEEDVIAAYHKGLEIEESPVGRDHLRQLLRMRKSPRTKVSHSVKIRVWLWSLRN